VSVVVVHLLDASVAEGQFAHPVDAATDAAGRQAEVSVAGRCVESVRSEVVAAVDRISAHVNRLSKHKIFRCKFTKKSLNLKIYLCYKLFN